jgi:ubiquinone/menaquinone biosynthesis C-methylase UbiE
MDNSPYHQDSSIDVLEAFDSVAVQFDERFENEITHRIRNKIYSLVERTVHPPASLLDINCGTGIDAMALAQKGFSVLGLDASPGMIQEAGRKAAREPGARVAFSVGSFHHLSGHIPGLFDLAFSNFGGLNCTDDLSSVAGEVSSVLRPGGYFLAVVMPPFSLWEFFSYALRGQRRNALRRMRKGTLATGFDGKSFTVLYHSPRTFMDACSPWFELRDLIGLSIMSPTPQSTGFARAFPRLIRLLMWVDSQIERLPLFRSSGDHFIVICRKK